MTIQWSLRTWLGWVAFFFAWGFVIHGTGLVLHEVGGHGLAGMIVGCGIDQVELTYFGHGRVSLTPCLQWTWTMLATIDSAGLAVTISAGAVVMVLQRRAGLLPLTRLLFALLATSYLLNQLAYATTGGFHGLYDPARVAAALAWYGLHVLAWLLPLVLFAVSAVLGARAIVEAFREHFGSQSRVHALKQMVATLGAAGLLYFVAFYLEQTARTEMPRGVASQAKQIAAEQGHTPPFPIHRVVIAIGVAAFVLALARPVVRRDGAEDSVPSTIPRRHAIGVAVAALVCFVAITLIVRV